MKTIGQYTHAINILEELKEDVRDKVDPVSIKIYEQCVDKIEEYGHEIESIARNEAIKIIYDKLKLLI